ncbi:MAG: Lar family restriction alleviation protein [Planctomycetaceae bacterium]|nr:Lar family restriction alleviation protein [Planctomycetaceae bacterium]
MSEELRPCPFCGGEADVEMVLNDYWNAYCVDCGATTTDIIDQNEAIAAWNRRTPEPPEGVK